LRGRVGAGTDDPDREPSPYSPPHAVCSTGATTATRPARRNRGRQSDELPTVATSEPMTERSTDISTVRTIEPPEETR
jgi:hypothetical protein